MVVDWLKSWGLFGADGKTVLNGSFVQFGSKRFKAWEILKGLDIDDHMGNFGTVEILRGVEGLEEYQRGMLPGKSSMSRKAKELEKYA